MRTATTAGVERVAGPATPVLWSPCSSGKRRARSVMRGRAAEEELGAVVMFRLDGHSRRGEGLPTRTATGNLRQEGGLRDTRMRARSNVR